MVTVEGLFASLMFVNAVVKTPSSINEFRKFSPRSSSSLAVIRTGALIAPSIIRVFTLGGPIAGELYASGRNSNVILSIIKRGKRKVVIII